MRIVVLNGMGCVETGAQAVLIAFLKAVGSSQSVLAIVPSTLSTSVVKECSNRRTRVVRVSHFLVGRVLRVPYEFILGVLAAVGAIQVVNLSSYGVCLGGRYTLFFHAAQLLDERIRTGFNKGSPNIVKRWMLKTCCRNARKIVAQTEHVARGLRSLAPGAEPAKVVACHPELPKVPPGSNVRAFRKQLFYPCSPFAHKRVDLAISAARVAHGQNADIGLVLTSTGADESMLKFTGLVSREQVWDLLRGSGALLFTSSYESLGLPLLEALAVGLPVIAPRQPYAVEILGNAGIYFESDDPSSIAEAIARWQCDEQMWRRMTAARRDAYMVSSFSYAAQWRILVDVS